MIFHRGVLCITITESLSSMEFGKKIHEQLYSTVRIASGKNELPSTGIIDSQRVKTAQKGETKGMMQGKRLARPVKAYF